MGQSTIITITFRDCALRYGLSEQALHEFVDLGLVHCAEEPGTLQEEPSQLALLARLHHDLGLNGEGIDVVLAMRRRLLHLQTELTLQRARVAQLERYLHGQGPSLDL